MGLAEALALGRADLAFRLADRELSRIQRFAHGAPDGLMAHMAAYVTVSGGFSRDELHAAARAESDETGWHHPSGWRALADSIAQALHSRDGARPLEPDVIGEALLLRVWGAERLHEGCRAIVRAAQARKRWVVASVMRTVQDFCVGETPPEEPLLWLDALIDRGRSDLEFLFALEEGLPYQTLALRERALEVSSLLAGLLQALDESPEVAEVRAGILNNLGNRMSDLGRDEEAFQNAEEAVRLYRQVGTQRPNTVLPGLAISLNNLATMLSRLGRGEEALEKAIEAVSLYQKLAPQRQEDYVAEVANTLNTLANVLGDLGRREEAFQKAQETVILYRELANKRADIFLPGLARMLNNLTSRLTDLGRREEAFQNAKQAVDLYRRLACQRPDAFLPSLALSLNNLATTLKDLGREAEALHNVDEAASLYRQLANSRPEAFRPALAMSLNNLANGLTDVGHYHEALEIAAEAVSIRRQLAVQRPGTFLPDLAMSLNNLATLLSGFGYSKLALQAAEEAVGIYRRFAHQCRDAFLPGLALSLSNMATVLSDLALWEQALKTAAEAIDLYRQLAYQHPDTFLPDLARSLALGGSILLNDNPTGAVPRLEEAVRVLKPFFLRFPQAHGRLMGNILAEYLKTAEAANIEPDWELLSPLQRAFHSLKPTPNPSDRN